MISVSQMMEDHQADAVVRAVITNNSGSQHQPKGLNVHDESLNFFIQQDGPTFEATSDWEKPKCHDCLSPVPEPITLDESFEAVLQQPAGLSDQSCETQGTVLAGSPTLSNKFDCTPIPALEQAVFDTEACSNVEYELAASPDIQRQKLEQEAATQLMDLLMDGTEQFEPHLNRLPILKCRSLANSSGSGPQDFNSVVAAATAAAVAMAQAEEKEGSPYKNMGSWRGCSKLHLEDHSMQPPSHQSPSSYKSPRDTPNSREPPEMLSSTKKPSVHRGLNTPTKSTQSPRQHFNPWPCPDGMMGPPHPHSPAKPHQSKAYPAVFPSSNITSLQSGPGCQYSISNVRNLQYMPFPNGSNIRPPSRLSKSVTVEGDTNQFEEKQTVPGGPGFTKNAWPHVFTASQGQQRASSTGAPVPTRSDSCGGSHVRTTSCSQGDSDVQSQEWLSHTRGGSYHLCPHPPPAKISRTTSMQPGQHIYPGSTFHNERKAEQIKKSDGKLLESCSAPPGMINSALASQFDDDDTPDEGWMAAMKSHKRFQKDFQALYLPPKIVQDIARDIAALRDSPQLAQVSDPRQTKSEVWKLDTIAVSRPSRSHGSRRREGDDALMQSPCKKRHLNHPVHEMSLKQQVVMMNHCGADMPFPNMDSLGSKRKHVESNKIDNCAGQGLQIYPDTLFGEVFPVSRNPRSSIDSYEGLDSLLNSISHEVEESSMTAEACL